jgi:Ca2+-transporting ATPase
MKTFINQKVTDVIESLGASKEEGLTSKEVQTRLKKDGVNQLTAAKKKTIWSMIFKQLKDFLTIILIVAAILSIWSSGHLTDGLFIIAIVIINIILSIVQERNASNALEALKKMASPEAKVIRDGQIQKIDAANLVVGDTVVIEAGDYIPADLRLIESINLYIEEAALTGESVPSEKDAEALLEGHEIIGDHVNMAYMTTIVTNGRGVGIVSATGMNTQIGHIATMINEVEDESTVLQKKLDNLGKILGTTALIVCLIIFGLGLYQGTPVVEIFMISVSLAVAAIPEGLPAVVTVVLSMGMKRMVKKNAIVKSLSAVETLGSTQVICSDKTGTLTQNKMVVKEVYTNSLASTVSGEGYSFKGDLTRNEDIDLLTVIASLCNDSKIVDGGVIGDPTEGALVVLAEKNYQSNQELNEKYPRVDELAFDSDRKLMSTIHEVNNELLMYVKGAPDVLLSRATKYLDNGQEVELSEDKLNDFLNVNEGFAKKAMRVLAFGYRKATKDMNIFENENEIVFVGFVGIVDPPRLEAKEAIAVCHGAGIRVVMITGDHKITASAIGTELGILDENTYALSGSEIDQLSDDEFNEAVKDVNVFARVSPEHKVRIVKALRSNGFITSMTGDGVNDAPALKQADIGVAMGITGTDVSKEAADVILVDDNFKTIIDAVLEGRVIYANIRKFISFLLSCNIGEILIIFVAMILGFKTPLLAIQILFINLITDSFPAFALGLEKQEDNVLEEQPRDPDEEIIDKRMKISIGFQAVFLAASVLTSYILGLNITGDYETAVSFAYVTIVVGELMRGYSARSEKKFVFKMNPFSNSLLNYSVIFGIGLLLVTVYVPGVNDIFKTVPLSLEYFSIAFVLGFGALIGGEISKMFK